MSKPGSARYQDLPLQIAGSTKFGRYPKMSSEQTYNMILSDDWLVPFSGYKNQKTLNQTGQGRGIYSSSKQDLMFAVIDNNVWKFDTALSGVIVGNLLTFVGDVFITENNAKQVVFSDSQNLYVYNGTTGIFQTSQSTNPAGAFYIDFTPGYLTFQNGRVISPAATAASDFLWRLSAENDATSWPDDAQHQGTLQTKPDRTVACIRFPGRGNLLLVFGSTVAEQWYDVGAQLFPYQRSQSTNIDYGCINPASIADSENLVCWIAINEKSGPVITYTNGGEIKHISTDGINFKLAELTEPANCYGFMFKQYGHLFYVATWPADRLSYAYDFNTDKFYTLCDENMDAFIAKRIAFFNDTYYFVSIVDGNLYELSSDFTDYDYGNDNVFEIPRIRILPSVMMPDQSRFVAGYAGFTIEQGQFDFPDRDTRFILGTEAGEEISTQNHSILIGGGEDFTNNVPRIDMSVSKDGGVAFGSNVSIKMNPLGKRQNRLMWWRLGASNDLVLQFRMHGFGPFVAYNGLIGVHE